jgi:hypothetical protein
MVLSSLSLAKTLPAMEQTPSPMNLKEALVIRGSTVTSKRGSSCTSSSPSVSEGFDDSGQEYDTDTLSVTSAEDFHDSLSEAADCALRSNSSNGNKLPMAQLTVCARQLVRAHPEKWLAHPKSHTDLLKSLNAPAWWAEALPPRDADSSTSQRRKDSSSQLQGGNDGQLHEKWWSAIRHRTDHHFAAEKHALRHHDHTLARAGGTRRAMRKDFSARVKLESPIAPLPAPACISPNVEESVSLDMLSQCFIF